MWINYLLSVIRCDTLVIHRKTWGWTGRNGYDCFYPRKPHHPSDLISITNKYMADIINKETVDTYLAHEFYHQSFHSDCSSCHRENRLIQAHRVVNRKILKVCKWCKGTGIITRTEWTDVDGKDMSYDVETQCVCREE